MSSEILIAVISCIGTIIGSFTGVIASAKLTTYRIEQLEKKVEKHNSLIERMTAAEHRINEIINKIG